MTKISKRDKASILKMLNSKSIKKCWNDCGRYEKDADAEQLLEAIKEKNSFIQEIDGLYVITTMGNEWYEVAV